MDTFTIAQLLSGGAAIAAGTFALVKYSNANAIRALEDRLKLKDDRIHDFEEKIDALQVQIGDRTPTATVYLPAIGTTEEINNPKAQEIAKEIGELESKRDQLLSQLASLATVSLDPRSELSGLLAQLESNDQEVRSKAIDGLMELKDPLSFPALVDFLMKHPDESISRRNPPINKWFSTLIAADSQKGVEFVVSQIESDQPGWADVALTTIRYELDRSELIDAAIPSLESVALRHPSPTTRTKAKILIQHLKEKKKQHEEREKRYEEIEKSEREFENTMAQLKAENKALQTQIEQRIDNSKERGTEIPSEFCIISALKNNGLNKLAHFIIHNGRTITVWNTGAMIAEEYASNPKCREGCISALKQILETTKFISKPSRAFLLFLLGQMNTDIGEESEGKRCFLAARELSEDTVDFLKEQKEAFNIMSFAPKIRAE
ncbi:MAG: hypothetical protein AB1921_06885 [Thermodesulfobacteriota bacterium]